MCWKLWEESLYCSNVWKHLTSAARPGMLCGFFFSLQEREASFLVLVHLLQPPLKQKYA